ncbi:bifunctional cobalt-precorrin-7 (C(5))-methyltransferase/cobalt-precorrin-6B (C(15))-methyltransferase, partial [Ameyamaea chiangmaiensis]|nr:bifunctional cobalt-precorrin-7 (C(5))-methyltransferase/cobalt-precorrin-6B (C(15))-methyltransferase [Ameyamaea chiangmaiensis]
VGGGVSRAGVLDAAWEALRPGGRCVANAVTLEGEAALIGIHTARGGTLLRLGVERLGPVGGLHAFRPAMTVTQWVAIKP